MLKSGTWISKAHVARIVSRRGVRRWRRRALPGQRVLAVMLALSSLCIFTDAFAYGSVTARVMQIRVDQNGLGMVIFDQPIGGTPPGCVHPAYVNGLSFDANTAGGRSILAVALTAKATGDAISAIGTGACSIYGGSWVEDWSYGQVL